MSSRPSRKLGPALASAISSLDLSFSASVTITRLQGHRYTWRDSIYLVHIALAIFWVIIMNIPPYPYKLAIPVLYIIALIIPFTSQFFFPAIPIFSWILAFHSSRFIPPTYRPPISVSLLPTLESVLYGANISDILTRFTHPVLDILAWIPYGVIHYTAPLVVAFVLWIYAPKPTLKFWASAFGYQNLVAVIFQILLPCAAPWYELMYGLTPADYSVKGSPGGLARIDDLFGSKGYTTTFSNSPLVFGAFPSLHAAWATLIALFISHFFGYSGPNLTRNWVHTGVWVYAAVLYWATMYLTHHYLIDVVGGACLATASFYFFLPTELALSAPTAPRSKYDLYDLDVEVGPIKSGGLRSASIRSSDDDEDDIASPALGSSDPDEEESDIGFRPPPPPRSAPRSRGSRARTHQRHASIASLIGADERTEDGWGGWGIVPPPRSPRTPRGGAPTQSSGAS